VEDNVVHARVARTLLQDDPNFELEQSSRLSHAVDRLAAERFDVVLLDLFLPDSQGLDTYLKVAETAPDVAVLILTALDDDGIAVEAIQRGAQDFLLKDSIGTGNLVRSVRLAVQRQQALLRLRRTALIDGETGFYNRRGLIELTRQQIALARRTGKPCTLLFIDLPDDERLAEALPAVTDVLKSVVRASDVVGRTRRDELCVLLVDDMSDPPKLWERLTPLLSSRVADEAVTARHRRWLPFETAAIEDMFEREDEDERPKNRRQALLLVDDEESIREMRRAFNDADYYVLTASTGREALRMAALEQPDLLLLDTSLPDLAGVFVARQLREQPETENIPILMLTRPEDNWGDFEAFQHKVQGILPKPFNEAALRIKVQEMLRPSSG
jgi:two-component system, cell cycle response regulator